MTPAERRRVARVLREAARIVAEGEREGWHVCWSGACVAIWGLQELDSITEDDALRAFKYAMGCRRSGTYYWPRDKEHRSVRVIALLFAAEAVLTGDCDD